LRPRWKDRLRDAIVAAGVAGGAALLSGCPRGGVPVCNANPDPCCGAPDSQECSESKACVEAGGLRSWQATGDGGAFVCVTDDAGVPQDLEPPIDASHD
jgi:hypothetical protein